METLETIPADLIPISPGDAFASLPPPEAISLDDIQTLAWDISSYSLFGDFAIVGALVATVLFRRFGK